jgi:hypothetical protein
MKTKNRNKTAQKQKLKRRQRNGFRNKTKKLRSKKQYSRQRFLQMGGGLLENVVRMIMTPLDSGDKKPSTRNIEAINRRIGNVNVVFRSNPQFDFKGNSQPGDGNPNGNTLLYAVCRMRPFTKEVSRFIYYLAEDGYVNNVSNTRNGSLPQHGLVQTLVDILGDAMLTDDEKNDQFKWIRASLHTLYSHGAIMSAKNNLSPSERFTALEEFDRVANIKHHLDRLPIGLASPTTVVSKFDDIRHLLTPEPDILVPLIKRGDIVKHINVEHMRPPYYFFVVDNVRYYFCEEIKKSIEDEFAKVDYRSQSLFGRFEFNHKNTKYKIEGTHSYGIEAIEKEYSNEIVTEFGSILIQTADNKKARYQLNKKNETPPSGYPSPGYPPSGYP